MLVSASRCCCLWCFFILCLSYWSGLSRELPAEESCLKHFLAPRNLCFKCYYATDGTMQVTFSSSPILWSAFLQFLSLFTVAKIRLTHFRRGSAQSVWLYTLFSLSLYRGSSTDTFRTSARAGMCRTCVAFIVE